MLILDCYLLCLNWYFLIGFYFFVFREGSYFCIYTCWGKYGLIESRRNSILGGMKL